MKNILIFITSFLLFFVSSIHAQPGKIIETWDELAAKADYLMDTGSYYSAADYYTQAAKKNPSNVDLKYKRAEAHRLGRNYRSAAGAYKSLRRQVLRGKIAKDKFPLIHYHYGMTMKQAGNYEEAEEALYQFIQEFDASVTDEKYKKLARVAYDGCQLARKDIPNLLEIEEVDALNKKVNSKYSEGSAFPLEDGSLLYASLKENESIEISESQRELSRLYLAHFKEDGKVKNVEKFSLSLPGGLYHVGSAAISPDGEYLYLTICEQTDGEMNDCDIYQSKRNGSREKYEWGRPTKMPTPINGDNSENVTPFPAKASDGADILYFASNREGGQGGMDIWAARGTDGNFTEVVNLGKKINTIGDEISPYLDTKGLQDDPREVLYFSSNGHPSLGGMDIFLAQKNNVNFTEWSSVQNLGKNINSTADEFSFIIAPSREKAYFVSNRVGGYSISGRTCCDDVFLADLKVKPNREDIIVDIKGRVYNKQGRNMENVTVKIYDVTNSKTLFQDLKTSKRGYAHNRLFVDKQYLVEVSKKGYKTVTAEVSTMGIEDNKTIKKDFRLKRGSDTPTPPAPNYCLGTFKAFHDKGSSASLSTLSNVKIRVEKIVKGKSELFKEITTDNSGQFQLKLPQNSTFRVVASKGGFLKASKTLKTHSGANCDKQISFSLKEKKKNIAFKLENILYDYDSANLRDESIPNLEVLLGLLNDNPNIIIELGSHTDSKGPDSYNQKLSQRRAQSVVDWLINRGISRSRLVAKGYGESQPIAPNTNPDGSDNPEGRQLNRRTEFKIIGDLK